MKTAHGHMNLDPSGVPMTSPPASIRINFRVYPGSHEADMWQATFAAAICAGRPPFIAAEYAMEGVLCYRAAIKGGA